MADPRWHDNDVAPHKPSSSVWCLGCPRPIEPREESLDELRASLAERLAEGYTSAANTLFIAGYGEAGDFLVAKAIEMRELAEDARGQ